MTQKYFVPQLETTNKNKSCASEEVVADVAKLTRPLWQDLPKAAHCSAEGRDVRTVDLPQVAESWWSSRAAESWWNSSKRCLNTKISQGRANGLKLMDMFCTISDCKGLTAVYGFSVEGACFVHHTKENSSHQ